MGFNREFEINESQIAEYLQTATEKVKTTENVDVLSDLYKLFKKNVPLTMRKYVVAYMLKEGVRHVYSYNKKNNEKNINKKNNNKNKESKNKKNNKVNEATDALAATKNTVASKNIETKIKNLDNEISKHNTATAPVVNNANVAGTEERPRHPRVEIAPEDAASVFVSIGKNRRVYPRDLVGILIAIAGLERDRIGDIKVLANYSFVQLYKDDAEIVIDKLNGYDYRGRKLVVSYSKQKDGKNEVPEEVLKASKESEKKVKAEVVEAVVEK